MFVFWIGGAGRVGSRQSGSSSRILSPGLPIWGRLLTSWQTVSTSLVASLTTRDQALASSPGFSCFQKDLLVTLARHDSKRPARLLRISITGLTLLFTQGDSA